MLPRDQEHEDLFRAAPIIGWFRRDETAAILRLLLPMIVPTAIGSWVVGFAYVQLDRLDPLGFHGGAVPAEPAWSTWLLFALGFLLIVSGPGTAIWGLRRTWRNESFLLLRTDALVHRDDGRTRIVPWDDVAKVEVSVDPVGLRLVMRDGDEETIEGRYAGLGSAELAKQLDDIRRKATFGLLT